MCNSSFVCSLQYTAECGSFHLAVTITVFRGNLPCFIVMVMLCVGNAHADHTHTQLQKKITDVFASKPITVLYCTNLILRSVQYFIFFDVCMLPL